MCQGQRLEKRRLLGERTEVHRVVKRERSSGLEGEIRPGDHEARERG